MVAIQQQEEIGSLHNQEDDNVDEELMSTISSELVKNILLPDDLNIHAIIDNLKYENVITTAQFNSNNILASMGMSKYEVVCKLVFKF